MAGRTKEERYLLAIYRLGKSRGDVHMELTMDEVAREIGFPRKSTENIVNRLAGGNFITKIDRETFVLSTFGLQLAQELDL